MTYNMYLDDIRNPKTSRDWCVVRSFDEATKMMLSFGIPEYISFDHDLGEADERTGYDLAKWIVEQDMDGKLSIPDVFEFNVHSANSVGTANIQSYLDSYINWRQSDERT